MTATKTDGISKLLDNVFDSAFNESQVTGDLPHVKWGRMDYLNVTRVTTKWALWKYVFYIPTRFAKKKNTFTFII